MHWLDMGAAAILIWLAYGVLRAINDGLKQVRAMHQTLENLFRYANHQYMEIVALRQELDRFRLGYPPRSRPPQPEASLETK